MHNVTSLIYKNNNIFHKIYCTSGWEYHYIASHSRGKEREDLIGPHFPLSPKSIYYTSFRKAFTIHHSTSNLHPFYCTDSSSVKTVKMLQKFPAKCWETTGRWGGMYAYRLSHSQQYHHVQSDTQLNMNIHTFQHYSWKMRKLKSVGLDFLCLKKSG